MTYNSLDWITAWVKYNIIYNHYFTTNSPDLQTDIYDIFVQSVGYLSWFVFATLGEIKVIGKPQIAYII